MKVLRQLLILLFSLTLPLNGYAALAAVLPSCPMSQDQNMASMSNDQSCCCHCHDSGDKHSTPGKCDQNQCAQMCKTANPLPALSVKFVPFALSQWLSLPPLSARIISSDASGVWRPPRLL
ncbi:hypothetical protein ACFDAU_08590 [Sulfuriferula sp. GW1]|uniref:hypothetical protein n=1 Tax=Sulfuriferula sp. GW1 TaxID=3345111 RepID=UPI0039AF91E2